MNKKPKITLRVAERDGAGVHPEETPRPSADRGASYGKGLRVLQPISSDLTPPVSDPSSEDPSKVEPHPAVPAPEPLHHDLTSIYPTPGSHHAPGAEASEREAMGEASPALSAVVIIVGVLTTLISAVLLYELMVAFTGELVRLRPTVDNVLRAIVLALQALLGIGIIMRREAARKYLVFLSIVVLAWTLGKFLILLVGSAPTLAGVPEKVVRGFIILISLQILVSIATPVFFIIFFTRRHVANAFD